MKALAVVLLALSCVTCGDDQNDVTGPTPTAVSISGRVIAFFSREPLRSASVEFRSSLGSAVVTTVSGASGEYTATLPSGGEYLVYVTGSARGIAYVGGRGFRGDLIIHDGNTCVARYGMVTDVGGRPLPNAVVSLSALSAVSAADGWYSLEFGCPPLGIIGGNTILMNVSRDGYSPWSRVVGRGIVGVQRFDVALQKPN